MSADAAPLAKRSWRGRLLSPGFARLLVVVTAVSLCAVQVPLAVHVHGISVLASLVLGVAHGSCAPLALWFARQAAVLSIAASTLLMLTVVGSGHGVWPWGVVPLITQVLVVGVLGFAASGAVTALTLIGSLGASAAVAVAATDVRTLSDSWSNVMLFAGLAVMAAALGAVLRQAADIGVDLHRQREISAEEHERRSVVEEKARIARELHDVIAHNMSLITVQAQVGAPPGATTLSPAARRSSREIADLAAVGAGGRCAGCSTCCVRRRVSPGRVPVPGIDGLADLFESARGTGQESRYVAIARAHRSWPAEVGTAVYRIVQEALSNAPSPRPGVGHRRADDVVEEGTRRPRRQPAPTGRPGLVHRDQRRRVMG